MSKNDYSLKGAIIWLICTTFFLYEFLLRTIVGTFQVGIMADINITNVEFSLISTTVFLSVYGLLQVPAGIVLDNIGLKKSLSLGALLCSMACVGFALSVNLQMATFCRVMMAIGASFGFVAMIISVNEWLPQKRKGLFIGVSQFIGTLGPIIAAGPLNDLAENSPDYNWRFIFICLAFTGGLLALLVFLFVENNYDVEGKYIVLSRPEKAIVNFKNTLTKPQVWFIAVLSALIYSTLEYLAENEGRGFLVLHGVGASEAAYIISISWIGYALGCPLLGYLSDLIERRKIILILSALIGVLSITILLYFYHSLPLIYFAFFCLGVSASGQTVGFAIMSEQIKPKYVAVGVGLNNAAIALLTAINAPLIAIIAGGSHGNAITSEGYVLMFKFLLLLAVISLLISTLLIKETFCKSTSQPTILKV